MGRRKEPDRPSDSAVETSGGRRLMLMRHAKAAYPDGVDDHERPLAGRGRQDAPQVGQWLAEVGWVPDLLVTSDAVRTRQTAELVLKGLGREIPTVVDPRLYECDIADAFDVIQDTRNGVQTLLIVGHEPTMSATTAVITGRRVRFPTAAVARIELEVPWAGVEGETGDLEGVRSPRE